MKDYYSIHEFSKKVNVTPQTLRNWERSGRLIPHHKGSNGYRYYSHAQMLWVLNQSPSQENIRKIIGYCRVSSTKQKDDLERQTQNMQLYLSAQGKPFEIITDIGSGLNYNKKGLNALINAIEQNTVEKVVVLYKDRLLRYGFELVEYIAKFHGTQIEVIDNSDKSEPQELVEDLIQIITAFSCRLQGRQKQRTIALLSDLRAEEVQTDD